MKGLAQVKAGNTLLDIRWHLFKTTVELPTAIASMEGHTTGHLGSAANLARRALR